MTRQEIKDSWQANGKAASEAGTVMHAAIEYVISLHLTASFMHKLFEINLFELFDFTGIITINCPFLTLRKPRPSWACSRSEFLKAYYSQSIILL